MEVLKDKHDIKVGIGVEIDVDKPFSKPICENPFLIPNAFIEKYRIDLLHTPTQTKYYRSFLSIARPRVCYNDVS